MYQFVVGTSRIGNTIVIGCSGRIVPKEETDIFHGVAGTPLIKEARELLIDLNRVSYIDSCGIDQVLSFADAEKGNGKTVKFVCSDGRTKHLIKLKQPNPPVFNTVADAIRN